MLKRGLFIRIRTLLVPTCSPHISNAISRTICVQKLILLPFLNFLIHKSHFHSANTCFAQTNTTAKKIIFLRTLLAFYYARLVSKCAQHKETTQKGRAQNKTQISHSTNSLFFPKPYLSPISNQNLTSFSVHVP